MKKILFILAAFLLFLTTASALEKDMNVWIPWDGNYVKDTTLVIPFYIRDVNLSGVNDVNITIKYATTKIGASTGTTIISDINAFNSAYCAGVNYTTGFQTAKLCRYIWTVTGLSTDTNYWFNVKVKDWNHLDQGVTLQDKNTDSNSMYYDLVKPATASDAGSQWHNVDANVHLACTDLGGCATIYYNLNGGGWNTYDRNILIRTALYDGEISLQYYSKDRAGNTEDTHTSTVYIGKTRVIVSPLFTAINGMFDIFAGIISGVGTQAGNIGQTVAISIIIMAVLGIIGALFLVFRKSIGGWMTGIKR